MHRKLSPTSPSQTSETLPGTVLEYEQGMGLSRSTCVEWVVPREGRAFPSANP